MPALRAAALVSLLVLLAEHCASITLARYTQQRVDAPRPASTVAVLLSELLKLALSLALELGGAGALGLAGPPASPSRPLATLSRLHAGTLGNPVELARLSVPALLYTLQNNLIYVALANLEIPTFQVLYQSRVVLTAVLSVAFLSLRPTRAQWVALALLAVGILMVELAANRRATPITPVAAAPRPTAGIPAAHPLRMLAEATPLALRHRAAGDMLLSPGRAGAARAVASTGVGLAAARAAEGHNATRQERPRVGPAGIGAARAGGTSRQPPHEAQALYRARHEGLGAAAALASAGLSSTAGASFGGTSPPHHHHINLDIA
jgi:multidrug transporter EmrE-like cation transporter